ncbi:Uncharacterised protein [uncultured Avibacterium sp.]|uniref:Uncharacterized protein n=1 Tax=uncultured Avibacterium sp. TaxID=1936169 RepID=A0A486XA21_9PAST|nr:Uncharacterised protein [uncultured Avibacterium sp.]
MGNQSEKWQKMINGCIFGIMMLIFGFLCIDSHKYPNLKVYQEWLIERYFVLLILLYSSLMNFMSMYNFSKHIICKKLCSYFVIPFIICLLLYSFKKIGGVFDFIMLWAYYLLLSLRDISSVLKNLFYIIKQKIF